MSKLIIFDCDGVLIDSEILFTQSAIRALENFGIKNKHFNPYDYIGKGDDFLAQSLLEHEGIKLDDTFFDLRDKLLLEAFAKELQPLLDDALVHLSDNALKRCIASNSTKDRILYALNLTGQIQYFKDDHIFTSAQVAKGKPAPDVFLFAAQQMGYEPQDCLIIEDSLPGIQAAKAANIPVIGFLGATHSKTSAYEQMVKEYQIPLAYCNQSLIEAIQTHLLSFN